MLDKWAREQDTTAWYRFSSARSMGSDPGEETEAIGDADAIKSTSFGIKNLQRVVKGILIDKDAGCKTNLENLHSSVYGGLKLSNSIAI